MTHDKHARAMKDLQAIDERLTTAMDQLNRRDPAQRRVWDLLDLTKVRSRNLAMFLTLGHERPSAPNG